MGRLQSELKKKNPFDSPVEEALINLLRTGDQIQNRLGRFFREYGITSSQYNVLRILKGEGDRLPSQEIAARTIQVVPAMTGLLDRLESQELVVRERCPIDRRVIYIRLTDKGAELVQKINEPMKEIHQELLGHFNEQELAQFSALLEKAREGKSKMK